jgi:hypothetical protein
VVVNHTATIETNDDARVLDKQQQREEEMKAKERKSTRKRIRRQKDRLSSLFAVLT